MAKAPSTSRNRTLLDVSRASTKAAKASRQRRSRTPQGNIQKSARVAAKKKTTR